MSGNHVAEFGAFTLERLPLGRAAGRIFVLFVRTGPDLLSEGPDGWFWRGREFLTFESDGRQMKVLESGGGGGDTIQTHLFELEDSGERAVTITYSVAGRPFDVETVVAPAP